MTLDSPKLPLNWRRKRTPTRKQRRSRNWQRLHVGYRIAQTKWTLVEGPWRVLKPSGSLSRVRVLCDPRYGGCGQEYDRHLSTIIQGKSTQCIKCLHRSQRAARKAAREALASEQAAACAETGAGVEPEAEPDGVAKQVAKGMAKGTSTEHSPRMGTGTDV